MPFSLSSNEVDETGAYHTEWSKPERKTPIQYAAAKLLQSCPTLCDPIDISPPGSLSLWFSRQEHWSALPFPSPICIYMEFRKKGMITLYARQQKRHRCIEWTFGLWGRGRRRGWDDLGEWHWNMYIIICEMNHQSRFKAWYRVLGAGALGWPRGMV